MPNAPLLDPTKIDASPVAARHADVYRALKQANRFALLDGVYDLGPQPEEGGLVAGFKEIRTDDWWTTDHIPGRPIFPGVLMVEAAAQLCSYDYLMRFHGGRDMFLGFGGTNETRFRGIVAPPGRMTFVGAVRRVRKTLFTYYAQGFYGGELVFESEVIGVAL